MKMPEKPKRWKTLFEEKILKNPDIFHDRAILDLAKKYDEKYTHWDELRRKDIKEDPETVWALMKLSRNGQFKHVNFADVSLTYIVTNQSQRILYLLDKNTAGLMVTDEPLKKNDMKKYVITSLMEEAIASSQIEGAVTTTKAAKRMLRERRKPKSQSEQMIVNDFLTMQRIKEMQDAPLTIQTILELHKLITHDTLDDSTFEGRFRIDDEVVVADLFEAEKVYHQPPSHLKIHEYMGNLCKFANEDTDDSFQHPLVKAIIIHYVIGYVHPFVDGNGRLARALMYWYALKCNYWLFEHMAISKIIKQSKGRYNMSYLHSETDDNDITYFINFNLWAMERALDNTKQFIKRQQMEQKEAKKYITAHPELNYRQAEMLKVMIEHKGEPMTISEMMSRFNIVHQTARTDLHRLTSLGLLTMRKRGRTMVFTYVGDQNHNDVQDDDKQTDLVKYRE